MSSVPLDTSPDVISWWLGGVELVAGAVLLIIGLRHRGRPGDILAPVGTIVATNAFARLLRGTISDRYLVPAMLMMLGVSALWFARGIRAQRARAQEMLKQRREVDRS